MNDHFLAAALLALTVFAANLSTARAQSEPKDQGTPAMGHETSAQTASQPGEKTEGASLTAVLVDAQKKAQNHAATVSVKVKGVKLVDPAQDKEKPVAGHAHLHYKVDDGPVIATTAPKLSFHELKSGAHTITVMLAAQDHSPLGPSETLSLNVP